MEKTVKRSLYRTAYMVAYNASPKAKAMKKAYDLDPVVKANKVAYNASPEGKSENRRRNLNKIGWTPEMFEQTLIEQGNACALCRKPFTEEDPACADHKHRHCLVLLVSAQT